MVTNIPKWLMIMCIWGHGTFNYNHDSGNFHQQFSQAKKAHYSLMKIIIKFNLPVDIELQSFGQLVLPVLLYWSDVWCFAKTDQTEIFYKKFLKELLGVNKCTTNVIVYMEKLVLCMC